MKIKWTGLNIIVEVTAVGGYKLKDIHGHCLRIHFPPKQVKWYYQEMQE